MSCSKTQHGDACGDRTQDLSIRSPTLRAPGYLFICLFVIFLWPGVHDLYFLSYSLFYLSVFVESNYVFLSFHFVFIYLTTCLMLYKTPNISVFIKIAKIVSSTVVC